MLDQSCRGYITGQNCANWETHEFKHIFNDGLNPANVICAFFRFEYQNRRCIHLHMLVWVNSLAAMQLNMISVTIPDDGEDSAFLVHRLQPSDKKAQFLKISSEPNNVVNRVLKLLHTEQDFEFNLRAYFNSRRTLRNINTQRHGTTQEIWLKDQQPGDSYQQLF